MNIIQILLILFSLFANSPVFAETIKLKNGKIVEGKIINRNEDRILVDTGLGVNISYYLDEVESPVDKAPVVIQPPIESSQPLVNIESFRNRITPKESSDYQFSMPIPIPEVKTDLQLIELFTAIDGKLRCLCGEITQGNSLEQAEQACGIDPIIIKALLILWILSSSALMVIAMKFSDPLWWLALIPIVNLYLVKRLADKPFWWFIMSIIPVLSIFAIGYLWMQIAKLLRQPSWLGLISVIPGLNVLLLWYLALNKKAQFYGKDNERRQRSAIVGYDRRKGGVRF